MDGVPGWRRFVNKVVPEHAAPFTIDNDGLKFAGNFLSYIDREVYLFGGYERHAIAAFFNLLPSGRRGTILDVGANAGNHTLAFSRVFQKIHAFEPNPLLWSQFERNVQINDLAGCVTLHKVGLADRDDELTLHTIDKPNMGLGTFSTVEQYDMPLKALATCFVRTGSEYLKSKGIAGIDAVKIDVQGFEPEVLRGLRPVLASDRPVVWLEVGAGTKTQMNTLDQLAQLVPFSFACYSVKERGAPSLITDRGELPRGDYVLVPR